jgi:hypothetical protein
MTISLMKHTIARLLSATIILLVCGCATKNYRGPITGFQSASAHVIAASRNYYELANKVERDHLIDDRAATGDPIDPMELKAVGERFSPEDIAVRLDALGILADYGALLLQLATSDAPQEINTQVDALSTSVGTLSDRLSRLCTNCSAQNEKFKTAFGAVASALKPILNQIVLSRIEKGLESSINNAEKPVTDLITALREDLKNLYERRKQAVSLALSDATRAYNNEAKLGAAANKERLQVLADRTKLAADRVEQLPTSSPDAALSAMDRAHRALVAFANRKKTPQTLAELADAVQAFAIQAQQVGQAVRTLVEL